MMKIKRLAPKDVEALYALGLQQFKGEYWYTKKFVRDSVLKPGYNYGLFEGNKLLGGILIQQEDRPKLWIYFFIVEKSRRREGIGTALLKTVEKLRIPGFNYLFVDFEPTDILAKSFYVKNGFKLSATIKHWFGRGSHALLFFKQIY